MRRSATVVALLLVVVAPSWTFAEEPDARVSAVPVAPGVTWEGQQYPAVDDRGRVYLLRTKTLEIYPVEGHDSLGEPRKLRTSQVETPAPVLDARMDRHGDWVMLQGAEVRWFPAGKEKAVPPLHWLATAVALANGRPVAAVVPVAFGEISHIRKHGVPFLLSADTDRWSTLVESNLEAPEDPRSMSPMNQHAGHLYAAANGQLCFANLYRYRFECFSPGGRKKLDVEVGGAKIGHLEADDAAVEAARAELEEARARTAHPERVRVAANTGIKVILDLTEGVDGRLYLLLKNPDGEGLALDRFDNATGKLMRIALEGAEAKGAMSMVAGQDGLFLAAFNGESGRYLVPWEALDAAAWHDVDGVSINGHEVNVVGDDRP